MLGHSLQWVGCLECFRWNPPAPPNENTDTHHYTAKGLLVITTEEPWCDKEMCLSHNPPPTKQTRLPYSHVETIIDSALGINFLIELEAIEYRIAPS